MNAIISIIVIAIFTLVCGALVHIAPKVIDFVKAFIRWNFR